MAGAVLPPELLAARDAWNQVAEKMAEALQAGARDTAATMCDELAATLLAIATDPANKRAARRYAAEMAKLDEAQRAAALADAATPIWLPTYPEGRDPNVLCSQHPRFRAAAAEMAKLLLLAVPPPR